MRQGDAMHDGGPGVRQKTKQNEAPMIAAKAAPIGARLGSVIA